MLWLYPVPTVILSSRCVDWTHFLVQICSWFHSTFRNSEGDVSGRSTHVSFYLNTLSEPNIFLNCFFKYGAHFSSIPSDSPGGGKKRIKLGPGQRNELNSSSVLWLWPVHLISQSKTCPPDCNLEVISSAAFKCNASEWQNQSTEKERVRDFDKPAHATRQVAGIGRMETWI